MRTEFIETKPKVLNERKNPLITDNKEKDSNKFIHVDSSCKLMRFC